MAIKKFKYYLTNSQGLYYTKIGGTVQAIVAETELPNAPDGWQDQTINFKRDSFYSNVFRSFTIPLRFTLLGAYILRTRLYKYGPEDIVNLVIKRLNTLTGAYDLFYTGEIDFSKFSDTNEFFEVPCSEGGIMKFIKAYENTDYEIPLTGDGTVYVEMDGLDLQKKINYAIIDETTNLGDHTVGCAFANEEGTSFGVVQGSSPLMDLGSFNITTNDDRWILKCLSESVTFTLKGFLHLQVSNHTQDVYFYLKTNTGTVYSVVPNASRTPGNYTFTINTTFTINPGEKLFFLCQKTEGFGSDKNITYSNDTLYLSFDTHYKTTYIKARNPFNVAQDLLTKICGAGYTLSSSLLENCDIYLTSGDAVRGLSGAVIKTSWRKLFQSFHRNLNIGMSVSGTNATIAGKTDFFTTDTIFDIGKVKDCKFDLAEDYMFNTVKIGYPNQDYDDVNGRDEFNNTHQYTTEIKRISKELDITADYRADSYGIELLRINLENKTTVDNSSDNDTFMLDVVDTEATYNGLPLFNVNRPAFDSITGVLNPSTVFNVNLSPKRLLYKHGSAIRSGLWNMLATKLSFQSTEKNSSLVTVEDTETITENADVVVAALDDPYFIPVNVQFETQVPDSLLSIMEIYGNGIFTFEFRGNQYKGYCMEAKQKPSGNEPQQFSLLLTAENITSLLIHE